MTALVDGKHKIFVSCCMWNPRTGTYSEDFKIYGEADEMEVDDIDLAVKQALDWKHCRAEYRFEDDPCQWRTVFVWTGSRIIMMDDGIRYDILFPKTTN